MNSALKFHHFFKKRNDITKEFETTLGEVEEAMKALSRPLDVQLSFIKVEILKARSE